MIKSEDQTDFHNSAYKESLKFKDQTATTIDSYKLLIYEHHSRLSLIKK